MVTHVLQDRLMDMAAATTRNQGNRAATLIRRLYTMVFNICNLDPKGYLQAQPGYVKGQHHETAVEHKQQTKTKMKLISKSRAFSPHTVKHPRPRRWHYQCWVAHVFDDTGTPGIA